MAQMGAAFLRPYKHDQIALTWPKSAYIEVPKTLFPWLQAERSHAQPGAFCPYRRISPLTRTLGISSGYCFPY